MPYQLTTRMIAEIGYNHNGNFNLAKELIHSAKDQGLFGVKFQKWDIESFPDEIKKQSRLIYNSYGLNYYDHRKHLEFSFDQIAELKEYSESLGLEFVCSGKDYNSIKGLIEIGVKNIKVPSQRIGSDDIMKYLLNEREKRGLILMVSSGMSTQLEIIQNPWKGIADIFFHCISLYPAKLINCDFGFLRKYGFFNGYSSHETEGRAIKYAVALGCKYIERHYTLDRTMKGSDHMVSSDRAEMDRILGEIAEIEMILGNGYRVLSETEMKNREYYRSF